MLRAAAVLAAITLTLTACSSDSGGQPTSEPTREPATRTPNTPKPPSKARIGYTSTCQDDFPVVFTTGADPKFIADVNLVNSGDRDGKAIVRVVWLLVGGDDVESDPQVVDVPGHGRKRVSFSVPATLDQIGAMGAHSQGDRLCRVIAGGS